MTRAIRPVNGTPLERAAIAELLADQPDGFVLAQDNDPRAFELDLDTLDRPVYFPALLAQVEQDMAARDTGTQLAGREWTLDPRTMVLANAQTGKSFNLTDTENGLLMALLRMPGFEASRDELLRQVWGYRADLETHTLETHVYRLRQKIEADPAAPALLVTTPAGYRFAG